MIAASNPNRSCREFSPRGSAPVCDLVGPRLGDLCWSQWTNFMRPSVWPQYMAVASHCRWPARSMPELTVVVTPFWRFRTAHGVSRIRTDVSFRVRADHSLSGASGARYVQREVGHLRRGLSPENEPRCGSSGGEVTAGTLGTGHRSPWQPGACHGGLTVTFQPTQDNSGGIVTTGTLEAQLCWTATLTLSHGALAGRCIVRACSPPWRCLR